MRKRFILLFALIACGMLASASCDAEAFWTTENAAFVIPANVICIQQEAFAGSKMEEAFLQEDVKEIESRAIAECTMLRRVRIPSQTVVIADDAFWGCSHDLKIYGREKSAAQRYAYSKGFHFINELTGLEVLENTLPEVPAF